MAESISLENSQKDFLSSSTSVTSEIVAQKSEDFDHSEF